MKVPPARGQHLVTKRALHSAPLRGGGERQPPPRGPWHVTLDATESLSFTPLQGRGERQPPPRGPWPVTLDATESPQVQRKHTHSTTGRSADSTGSVDRSPKHRCACACVCGVVSLCGDMSPRDVELAHPGHSLAETKHALPLTWRGRGQCRGLRNPCRRSIWALRLRIWCGSQTTSATPTPLPLSG